MSDINPIARSAATYSPTPGQGRATDNAVVSSGGRAQDEVQLSDRARLLSKLKDLPEVRQEVVDRVKAEIEDGTYETPEKIDQAVDALLEDLET